jgi:hypothetical protein
MLAFLHPEFNWPKSYFNNEWLQIASGYIHP